MDLRGVKDVVWLGEEAVKEQHSSPPEVSNSGNSVNGDVSHCSRELEEKEDTRKVSSRPAELEAQGTRQRCSL